MTSLITIQEARAWGEKTKLAPAFQNGLDSDLLTQVQVEVLGNIAAVADTSTWLDSDTTPTLVKTIIAKLYVAWLIDRQYSEDEELSQYAALLRATALNLQMAIVSSDIDLPGSNQDTPGDGLPSVYPTDDTIGPYFSMEAVF